MRIRIQKTSNKSLRLTTPKDSKEHSFKTEFQLKEFARKTAERFSGEQVRIVGF